MEKKEFIKYFYEVFVSKNLLEDLPQYISENCILKVGYKILPISLEGMKQNLIDVKKFTLFL